MSQRRTTWYKTLHWRCYRWEIPGWDWMPYIALHKSPYAFYYRELSFGCLKWGFAIRWWWR